MARLQLIFPLLFWAIWRGTDPRDMWRPVGPWTGTSIYLAGLLGVVAAVLFAARRTMRQTTYERPAFVPRFHRVVFLARWMIVLLHALALWGLSYGDAVLGVVPDFDLRFDSLPAFASITPAVLAWVALIWAQFPIDRGVREQNALYAVELGEPVHAPPTRAAYVWQGIRLQVLFTLAPLLAIALVRDVMDVALAWSRWLTPRTADVVVTVVSIALVFVLAPELLRRVLPTRPLPASAMRERLQGLATRLKLGVRDILLWQTHHTMGNAAVMGVVPGVRYVLISDLLLETMTPDQIEAVFAHEAGHVVYRHIAWYVVFWLTATLSLELLVAAAVEWAAAGQFADRATAEWTLTAVGVVGGITLFGLLSRAFERQADAFAARTLTHAAADGRPARDGTAVFITSLGHVARLNNLPLDAHALTDGRPLTGRVLGRVMHHASTWLHGSIRSRMDHLSRLANDPATASRFDTAMLAVRWLLTIGLAVAGTAAALH